MYSFFFLPRRTTCSRSIDATMAMRTHLGGLGLRSTVCSLRYRRVVHVESQRPSVQPLACVSCCSGEP